MNDVIVELRKEREALCNRLARIDAAIEQYESWAESVAELVGGGNAAPVNDRDGEAVEDPTPIAAFEDEVRTLLERTSVPLKRAEVYEALTQAGVVVGGKNPLNTVASRLSRMDGIVNLRGHGYWAEDRPYPPAGHHVTPASGATLFDGDDTPPPEEGFVAEDDQAAPQEA